MPNANAERHSFLPEFGTFSMLLQFVILAELIAIIITIGRNAEFNEQAWQEFSLMSVFAIPFALCSIVGMKIVSPLLRRASTATGSVLVIVMLLLVTSLGIDGIIYLLHHLQIIEDRWPAWRETLLIRSLMIAAIVGTLGVRYLIMRA